jgi:hypothetical protein
VQAFKGASTRVAWRSGNHGRLWQLGFYDHLVRNSESMRQIFWYVRSNPLRAGLTDDADAYPWSGEPDPFPW